MPNAEPNGYREYVGAASINRAVGWPQVGQLPLLRASRRQTESDQRTPASHTDTGRQGSAAWSGCDFGVAVCDHVSVLV